MAIVENFIPSVIMSESIDQLDPNYVIAFDYSVDNLTHLVTELSAKGLHVLPRPGYDKSTLYAFTRVEERDVQNPYESNGKLALESYEESGDSVLRKICEPLTFVKSITPIHDSETRKRLDKAANDLIKHPLSFPTEHDLVLLERLTKNPRQALYFAYFRRYIIWLIPLSVIGAFSGLIRPSTPWEFNIPYTFALIAWGLLFTCSWVYRDHAYFGGKFGKVQNRLETSEKKFSKPSVVLCKKLCFVPVAVVFVVSLVSFQFFCFFIEIYATQFYSGPLKSIFSLVPTVLICSFIPALTLIYNKLFVDKLVAWEDGPDPERSKVEKNFVLTFFTSYMPLFITLFFYLPLGYKVTPELRAIIAEWGFRLSIPIGNVSFRTDPSPANSDFIVDVKRYRNQFFYFIVTNQVIAVTTENLLPIVISKLLPLLKNKKAKAEDERLNEVLSSTVKSYFPRELSLWKKVNSYHNSTYGEFDVDENFKKLVIQFGYLVIFSIIWPLAPLICFAFDFLIFKVDLWRALKKCKPSSKPEDIQVNETNFNAVPVSADPWNRILELIACLGGTTCPVLLLMYRYCGLPGVGLPTKLEKRDLWYKHSPMPYSWTTFLLIALLSEHLALIAYAYLKKLFLVSGEKQTRGFVPAADLLEPPQIDLTALVRETTSFMNKIIGTSDISSKADVSQPSKSENSKSTITEEKIASSAKDSDQIAENELPLKSVIRTPNEPAPIQKVKDQSITSDRGSIARNSVSNPQEVADLPPRTAFAEQPKPKQNYNNDTQTPEIWATEEKSNNNSEGEGIIKNSFEQEESRSSPSGVSDDAGATLPETIPTSKNYHLRYDKDGNPVQSLSSSQTSNSSLAKKQGEPIDNKRPNEELQGLPKVGDGTSNKGGVLNAEEKSPVRSNYAKGKEDKHIKEVVLKKQEKIRGTAAEGTSGVTRSLDPAKTTTVLPQIQQVHEQVADCAPANVNADTSLAAAAAKPAESAHSRNPSQVNAVQQFGRDVPAPAKAKTTNEPSVNHQEISSAGRASSIKSKAAASTDSRSSPVLKKGPGGNKRTSVDSIPVSSPGKTPEHKSKHKKGLLHKLKKKL